MSIYSPPTQDLPIFDKLVFQQSEEYITQGDADKRYLRFPNAQGTENLAQINVNGSATFNSTVNITSTVPPTSSQIIPATTDNSTNIPTTAWVQSLVGSYLNSVYTILYDTGQTITTPANCRCIDVHCLGAGGLAGVLTKPGLIEYYGGSGSGGNSIIGKGIPIGPLETLVLTFDNTSTTGSTTLTKDAVILARAFNGNQGSPGVINTDAAGGTTNNTIGVGDTSYGSWYNTFGSPGTGSTSNGTVRPSTTNTGTPKGTKIYVNGGYGIGQRTSEPVNLQGTGFCMITYYIDK